MGNYIFDGRALALVKIFKPTRLGIFLVALCTYHGKKKKKKKEDGWCGNLLVGEVGEVGVWSTDHSSI